MFRISPAALFAAAVLVLSGCAHPVPAFRLTGPAMLMIPPGPKDTTIVQAVVPIPRIPKKTICAASRSGLSIERKGRTGARVVVTRSAMDAVTAQELYAWTLSLESSGCLPVNESAKLAANIVDALPLSVSKRTQLLQGRNDLTPANSLRVVSPVLKPGAKLDGSPLAQTRAIAEGSTPGTIDVDVKLKPEVIGYEIDWYDFAPQERGPGYRVVPRSAEIHIGDQIEHPEATAVKRFEFGPAARWYELYMMTKVSTNDFDFVVFSARTSEELHNSVAAFQTDAANYLQTADPHTYTVLPHGSGINAYIRVKLNGVLTDLPKLNTIRQAIQQAGGDPNAALPKLKVRKLHDGVLYPVQWPAGTNTILSLPLEGGEEVAW
ncbi:MAG TPA: hypothetical protein VHC90_10265 [Bryobacteraceae bacterium]|nr:hypothetical protein [Bryobacteraceae bacterium]